MADAPIGDPRLGECLGGNDAIAGLAAEGYAFALGLGFIDAEVASQWAQAIELLGEAETRDEHPYRRNRLALNLERRRCASCRCGGPSPRRGGQAGDDHQHRPLIEHDCVIGRNVHIAPGVTLSGVVRVGANTLIGVGAKVIQGIAIGSGVVVGAGSVVVSDLPEGATAVGIPARVVYP